MTNGIAKMSNSVHFKGLFAACTVGAGVCSECCMLCEKWDANKGSMTIEYKYTCM